MISSTIIFNQIVNYWECGPYRFPFVTLDCWHLVWSVECITESKFWYFFFGFGLVLLKNQGLNWIPFKNSPHSSNCISLGLFFFSVWTSATVQNDWVLSNAQKLNGISIACIRMPQKVKHTHWKLRTCIDVIPFAVILGAFIFQWINIYS